MGNNLEMLDLNGLNVNRIFNDCLMTDATIYADSHQLYKNNPNHTITFDKEKILDNIATIQYLIGQLDDVHQGKGEMSIKSSVIRYDKKPWTKDMETLIHFYYLGMAASSFYPIDDATKTIKLPSNTPAVSPDDSNFEQWYKEHKAEWED